MRFIVSVFLVFTVSTIHAQQPAIGWSKVYGQPSSARGLDIKSTKDGNYIVLNYVNPIDTLSPCNKGSGDIWVIKIDPLGNILWDRCYGGSGIEGTALSRIETTFDGGYIFETQTESNDGDVSGNHGTQDVWVVKLDSVGNIQWQSCFGGGGTESPYSIITTTDTGYIFVAKTNSLVGGDIPFRYGGPFDDDAWVVKLNKSGEIVMNKIFGGTGNDAIIDAIELKSFYYLFGYSSSTDGNLEGLNVDEEDGWIMKINHLGEIIWTRVYGQNYTEGFEDVIHFEDSFIVGGFATDLQIPIEHGFYHGGIDYWVMKMDTNGNPKWQGEYGGTFNESFIALYEAPFLSGYYVIGQSNSDDGDVTNHHGIAGLSSDANDYWIVKIGSGGELVWEVSIGGTSLDQCYSMAIGSGNSFPVGQSESNDGDVINPFSPNGQTWIVNLIDFNSVSEASISKTFVKIVPQPTHEIASIIADQLVFREAIELHLFSVSGSFIKSYPIDKYNNTIHFDIIPGIYIYRIVNSKNKVLFTGDLIIQ